jgi:hypothetical protein
MRDAVFSALSSVDADALAEALTDAEDYRNELMTYYQDELSILEQRKDAIQSASEAMLDWVDDMRKATDAAVSPLQQLNNARAQYQTTLTAARAGDVDSMADASTDAQDYLDAIRRTASDPVEYARAYGRVVGQIEDLAMNEAEAQTARVVREIESLKSDTIRALNLLDSRLLQADRTVKTEISSLTALVETLETVDSATSLTLMDIAARTAETDRIIEAIAKISIYSAESDIADYDTDSGSIPGSGVNGAGKSVAESRYLGASQNQLDYYGHQLTNRSMTAAQIERDLERYIRNNSFADGGYHSGGLRLVGERGPELEVTGPSHVTPNHSIADAFSEGNRDMVSQITALREELMELRLEQRRQHHESARYQRDTADMLIKIDQTGLKTTEAA